MARNTNPATVEIALTLEQQEKIRQATGKVVSHVEVALDAARTIYREEWSAGFAPFRVGRSLVIQPIGGAAVGADGDIVIELAPGGPVPGTVFGTGAHATTQLSLVLLEERITPGDRMLDIGTGSGILAIGAAKLGARAVLALDIDPLAVAAARANVVANGLVGVVEVCEGSVEAAADPPYDLVVVNILAPAMRTLAPALGRAVRPGGLLIASGIVALRVADVSGALAAEGFRPEEERSQEEWRGLVLRRV